MSLSNVAYAGPGMWTTGGPYGGYVIALAIDPTSPATVYAGTRAGIFKSHDSGSTWAAANAGLTNLDVTALAVGTRDARSPATLYAGTYGGGIFKSTDSGATWAPANTGLTSHDVDALVMDPRTPATLYAGTDGGVFKSTDSAGTWTPANTGLISYLPSGRKTVAALAIDPSNPATLYAGTGIGVFKSTDSAGTWALAYANPLLVGGAGTIAIDPTNPATLYAGMDGGSPSPYSASWVIKSTDSGSTWATVYVSPGGAAWISALAIDPANPSTLYVGMALSVVKSTDSGGTWAPADTGLTSRVTDLAIDPTAPATLFAGTEYGGVFRSTDFAGTWAPANAGLTGQNVLALAIDSRTPATLYAGTQDLGAFKSTDSGSTWTAAKTGPLPPFGSVYALAIDPTNPATLYRGGSGLLRSTDSGGTWAYVCSTITTVLSIRALAVDPGGTLYVGGDGGILRSIDAGGTCTEAGTDLKGYLVLSLIIDPTTPATLYAGACDDVVYGSPRPSGGVFKSTDSGATWTATSSGLTNLCVRTLAIDPTNPATLYAGTRGGIFRSTDSGATWTATNTGLTSLDVGALVIHPTSPVTRYAGTGRGVFRSTDSGGTWTAVNKGLSSLEVGALALDPTGETTVHAGLQHGSVWQSTPPTEADSDRALSFFTLPPCRLLDTRDVPATFGGPALVAGGDRVFPLVGRCGIPNIARALSVNVTVTQSTVAGDLRLYPAGTPLPSASSINYASGQTRANNAIAGLSGRGKLAVRCAQASGTVHLILDVNGYFE